jgi:hypothetical protein
MRTIPIQALAISALLLAAACDDVTTHSPGLEPQAVELTPGHKLLGTVTCYVDAVAQTTQCGDLVTPGGANQTRVNLTTSHFTLVTAFSFTSGTSGGIANFYNSIRNDIGQDIGTHNGIISDSIRVFVSAINVTGGSGTVTAYNHHGTGTFTAANQPYWEYREIVSPTQQSASIAWQFSVPGTVTAWNYTVGVSAPIAHPNGWVEVTGNDQIPHSGTRQHTAVVYTWTGAVDNTGVVSWSSTDVSGSVYASPWDERVGTILGVRIGTAEVTASKGSATPQTYGVTVY